MSWSTDLFCNIAFNRKTYNTIYEVQDDIDELNRIIRHCEDQVKAYALMTEPKKFCDKEEDPKLYLSNGVAQELESLQEYYIDKYKLELLLDNWDECHTKEGLAIRRPDNIHWDSAFISGDFIKYKEDEAN